MNTSPKANILSTVAPHAGKTVSHLLGALAAISFVILVLSAHASVAVNVGNDEGPGSTFTGKPAAVTKCGRRALELEHC